MRYLLLIYGDEKAFAGLPAKELEGVLSDFQAYTASVKEAGAHIASQRLRPASTATSVRVRGGKKLITDGPFAETKEQLGGFYMIEAKDLDEAVAWAAKIPGARYGTIEVRPIWEM
ncbi:MAG TPA: YciI family protein [Planctomycetota bacterium]|nr:YciI family protein [Planctomycetota bacterium]